MAFLIEQYVWTNGNVMHYEWAWISNVTAVACFSVVSLEGIKDINGKQ
jgi:hypothetical protein